ncbi:protease, partial [Rhizobium leguminosarum]
DTLNGGAGADTLIGGAGDDTSIIDNAGDSIAEHAAAGTDTVRTILAAYTLGANVENLTYMGTAAFFGTGNSLADTITGSVGNDTLNGAAGADTMIGG